MLLRDLMSRASLAMDNARLYAAVRDAVRIRDEVLRIVVHDLRSPLNTVSIASGALREALPEERDPRLDKWLDAIGRSLGRANRLIEDLLDLARAQNHTLSVEREPLDPSDVVCEAAHARSEQAASAGIHLEVAGPRDLPRVEADHHRLLQVLDNLVGNALKFTPAGGTITVGAEPRDGGVRFWVSDTGPGIPREQQAHIFQPFWQGEARSGAGLGLAIAQGLVEAHGGALTVHSDPGAGATFEFTVPED